MSRKYEIVNVGGVKRVRALRSWVVQGRQVNVGDVGGAVFDERTLSQDGDAWIFSGRLDNPLVRVGGDSVVSIGEYAPTICPFVNIFGTSSLDSDFPVGFEAEKGTGAKALTPAMMEAGGYDGAVGQKIVKVGNGNLIRKTEKMFTGGGSFSIPAPAEGYGIRVWAVDSDGVIVYSSGSQIVAAAAVIPAGSHAYAYLTVGKLPTAATVPADITAAALTFPVRREATINIVDSHITLTGQSSGYVYINPSSGMDEATNTTNIECSTVQVNRTLGSQFLNLFCDLINTKATINMANSSVGVMGVYKNVKNLVWGSINWSRIPFFRTGIQATDCNNFVMDGINIPVATANGVSASNLPLVFIRCNMNKANIVNQPLIKNTYVDINFDLATADLGKLTAGAIMSLVSSNVNGMYRLKTGEGTIGALVEAYESVKDWKLSGVQDAYNTTIYADAYLKGQITFEGTNVFGNAVKKPKTRTIDVARVAVQGRLNGIIVGRAITGVLADNTYCTIPLPVNLRTAKGLTVKGITGNLQCGFYVTDGKSVISSIIGWAGDRDLTGLGVDNPQCYVTFRRSNSTAIKPEDLAGVTIETYNGSKIVNAKTGTMTIKGNVRVEDNAVLKDTSIEGTGYFGGDSVTETSTAATVPQPINGYAFMKDNAVFSPSSFSSSSSITCLHMQGNARMTGEVASANVNLVMKDNAEYNGQLYGICDITLEDRTIIPASLGVTAASYGKFTMKGRASLGANITIRGDITLCDNFRNTAAKAYSGKRVYASQDAPRYDNNVKTQYDF